jgi:hypothetical protein
MGPLSDSDFIPLPLEKTSEEWLDIPGILGQLVASERILALVQMLASEQTVVLGPFLLPYFRKP